ncbi:MAG: site-specific DNA-methyltransferase [Phycisphaerales bacterium]
MDGAVRQGDWLKLAAGGGLAPGSVDLLYTDPPFNTGKTQATPPGAGSVDGRDARAAYSDRLGDGPEFAQWLRVRLEATLPALKPSANVLIHVDWRTSHHVRLMLDELLGPDRFVNHLIWSYGLGGSSPKRFARKHDDILFYCLDPAHAYFKAPRIPATSNRMKGQTKKATDVLQIPSINNMAAERTGYPTQKPLALLELLIGACCPSGGTVLDPTCGSGTTLVAARSLGCLAVGFDLSPAAVKTCRRRLGLAD